MSERAWQRLDEELGHWRSMGRLATIWWRDDDAVEPTPALSRLLAVADGVVELAIAVIPARARPALSQELNGATVLQHGVDHQSRALPGEKRSEFPSNVSVEAELERIERAHAALGACLGRTVAPVFVPPWNRIGDELAAALLTGCRYRALSGYGHSVGRGWLNTHVDIVDWRGHRGFVGTDRAIDSLVAHLRERRALRDPSAAPTGLLTHHLVHDEGAWQFLERLVGDYRERSLHWVSVEEALLAAEGDDVS